MEFPEFSLKVGNLTISWKSINNPQMTARLARRDMLQDQTKHAAFNGHNS